MNNIFKAFADAQMRDLNRRNPMLDPENRKRADQAVRDWMREHPGQKVGPMKT